MTPTDWKRLLDEIAGMNGRPLVLLTGTQPLLYPRMLELLSLFPMGIILLLDRGLLGKYKTASASALAVLYD